MSAQALVPAFKVAEPKIVDVVVLAPDDSIYIEIAFLMPLLFRCRIVVGSPSLL